VQDTGVGVPLDQQQRIFEAFEQVDNSYSKKQQGTGLGLALCKRMVEMHGGRLSVKSAPDIGSTFSFTLPIRLQLDQSALNGGDGDESTPGGQDGEESTLRRLAAVSS